MKSSQSNFNLQSPGSYLVRSYLITTVTRVNVRKFTIIKKIVQMNENKNASSEKISTQ